MPTFLNNLAQGEGGKWPFDTGPFVSPSHRACVSPAQPRDLHCTAGGRQMGDSGSGLQAGNSFTQLHGLLIPLMNYKFIRVIQNGGKQAQKMNPSEAKKLKRIIDVLSLSLQQASRIMKVIQDTSILQLVLCH